MTTRPTIGANKVDGYVATAADWNNDVVQQDNWAQEVIAGTNADKIPVAGIAGAVGYWPNALVNGGVEIWQRGAGTFTGVNGTNVLTADRWTLLLTAPSAVTLARAAAIDVGSQYCAQVTYNHSGGGAAVVYQNVENFAEYRGKTVYLTARVSGNATGMYAQLYDGVASASSPRVTNTGAVSTVSATLAVNTSATVLRASFQFDVTGVYQIDNVMLALSPLAVDYTPRPVAEEWLLCTRYYQVVKVSQRWRAVLAGEARDYGLVYPTPMAGTPTATRTAGTVANVSGVTLNDVTATGLRVEATATAGTATTGTDTQELNDVITLEFNP